MIRMCFVQSVTKAIYFNRQEKVSEIVISIYKVVIFYNFEAMLIVLY